MFPIFFFRLRKIRQCCKSYPRCFSLKHKFETRSSKLLHCYKNVLPWSNKLEFSDFLSRCIVYNKDGLIAINKPFGIKIHSHDKPGTRYEKNQRFVFPSIPDCDLTIEDALPDLEKKLNLSNLTVLKSAERYTSGLVLLGTSDKVTAKLKKSFIVAKTQQKKPHLVHWAITLGYSAASFRQEKVGIKLQGLGEESKHVQPIIEADFSKRASKLKKIYAVQVDYRTISLNEALATSLVEIASSSVKWHFVRVYASNRICPILGDIMYGSRMKTLLGVPVKVQLQNAFAYGIQPVPEKMLQALNLPKGDSGIKSIPTMLHLRSIILPEFEEKGKDLIITADPPLHFQWTAQRLNLYEKFK